MSQITLLHDEQLTDKGTPKGSKGLCSSFRMDVSADTFKKRKETVKQPIEGRWLTGAKPLFSLWPSMS